MWIFLIITALVVLLFYKLTQKGRKEADGYFKRAAEYNADAIEKRKKK